MCAAGNGLRFTEYGQDWIEPIAEAQPAQTVQTGSNLATTAVLRALRIVAREITRWNRYAARVDLVFLRVLLRSWLYETERHWLRRNPPPSRTPPRLSPRYT